MPLRNLAIDAESADSFREIVRESAEAARLLEDMLALARSDAGHADAVFEPVDLAQIFVEAYKKVQPLADAKCLCLAAHADSEGPVWITGDAAGLGRLIWILLDNAIKYTPAVEP